MLAVCVTFKTIGRYLSCLPAHIRPHSHHQRKMDEASVSFDCLNGDSRLKRIKAEMGKFAYFPIV